MVSGDSAGLAEAYERYGAPLYAYCRSQLGAPEDAAGAVQDIFLVASSKLSELRDPGRLRPWLYTVARNACRRRLNAGARPASPDEEFGEAAGEPGMTGDDAAQRALVRAAVAALSPDQRDVVELSLRHKLSGADLADVLGISRSRANALAARGRARLRRSLRTLLAARLGRADCQELDALLEDWDGQLTDLLCKRVGRHTEHCAVCGERERADQAPEMLLSLLPMVSPPAELRRQVLESGGDATQAADLSPVIGHQTAPFDTSGFPAAMSRPRAIRVTGRTVRAAATGSAAVAVVAVIAAVALKTQHETISPAAAATGPGSVAAASATTSPRPRQGVNQAPERAGGTTGITPGPGAAPVIGVTPTPGTSSPVPSPAPVKTSPVPVKTSPAPVKTSPVPTRTSPAPRPTTPVPTTPVPTTPVPTTPVPTTPVPTTPVPTTPVPTTPVPTTTVPATTTGSSTPTVTTTTTTASPTASPSAVMDLLLSLSGLR